MRSLKYALAILLLFVAFSCSKKSESAGGAAGAGILENQTIAYIPASSIGFVTWDTQSESYKKMKASTFGQQMSRSHELIKQAEATADPDTQKYFKIYDALVQTGLWTTNPDQQEGISKGVLFFDIDGGTKLPQAALYANGREGINVQEKIAAIQKTMNEQGIKTAEEKVAGSQYAFTIALNEAVEASSPVGKLTVAANPNKFAIATTPALASRYFAENAENGIEKIENTNEFKQATKGINTSDSMTFVYFDVNKLITSLESLAATTGVDAGADDLKTFPVESLAASTSMDESLASVVNVSLAPKNEMQKNFISSLAEAGENYAVGKVPSDLMILLSLDGRTIRSAKNIGLASSPPGTAEMMGPMLGLIDSIKSLSIGVRAGSGATPFPEVLLVAESTKAGEIEANVKTQLEGAMASSGMPIPWQQKKVSDSTVSYAVSPFGVGAYLTSADDMVILASAEKLVSDVLAAGESKDKSLMASLSKSSKGLAENSKSLFIAYSDFNKVGNAITAAQDSLAMFTGGQGSIPQEQIENIKQMGSVFLSLNLDNNLVKIETNYEPPQAKS